MSTLELTRVGAMKRLVAREPKQASKSDSQGGGSRGSHSNSIN